MNLAAAAWKLSLYQIWNRKRRLITLGIMLFPVVIVIVAAAFSRHGRSDFYESFVTGAMGYFLIPFVGLYWGSGALTDEIEGKTLVYLWTRPRHRGLLIFFKLLGSWLWLILLALIGITSAYIFSYSGAPNNGFTENLPVVFWDLRALALSGIAYSSIGFFLSVLTKRPLTYGLLVAYMWELIPQYGPGFFKRISITQQMLALATHREDNSDSIASRLVEQVTIGEVEALLTLLGIILVFCAASIWLVGQKEFLADDPARNQ